MVIGGGLAAAGRLAPSVSYGVDPVLAGTGACLAVLLVSLTLRRARGIS
jgi:hypothetical protein